MSSHPKYCTVAYVISALLDAVDGQAARALGQTSKLGAMLDMITDRSARATTSHEHAAADLELADAPHRV